MPEMSDPAVKAAVKEAAREWLDAQFAMFGKWTAGGILSAALVGAVWLAMASLGWHR